MDYKKIKTNPCIVCLGLLQEESLTQIIQSDKLEKAKQYDSEVFTCSISMPAAILLRERSMQIYLKSQFPTFYKGIYKDIYVFKFSICNTNFREY